MVRKIVNKVLETRKEVVINCKEMTKDELFDIEECANFIHTNHKLSRHSGGALPDGPLSIDAAKYENKIALDLGVEVKRCYIKQLLRKYLHRKGLSDWIHIKVDQASGEFGLHYYNLNDE
ncbi:large subunit ribosomal protein L22e [Nematocida major]|uniref:large subunit ribosomal protein L22e n=1 Tax=Nematocida major TaxID=1912982 RepID=UPI002008D7AA|nr:large subunit ribosomal protein L22e [Nematocida major]KAH9386518.1 large subunit ribosomal protein L22e [Nematocida major]